MVSQIFVNYRRDDDFNSAGRLHDRLVAEFGREQVFMDVGESHLKPGDDFAQVLKQQVASCNVMLAVIGPRWLEVKDRSGARRLDSHGDLVRVEIVAALELGTRVIPVLVNNATIPHQDLLPDSLKKLAGRHAVQLRNEHFPDDCRRLMSQLRELLMEDEEALSESPADKTDRAGATSIGTFRGNFWAHFLAKHPDEAAFGPATRASSRWRAVSDTDFVVVKYLSKRGVGVFVRGARGADRAELADLLMPYMDRLARRVNADFNNEQYMFHKWLPCDGEDRTNWDRMTDWLKSEADRYDAALKGVLT